MHDGDINMGNTYNSPNTHYPQNTYNPRNTCNPLITYTNPPQSQVQLEVHPQGTGTRKNTKKRPLPDGFDESVAQSVNNRWNLPPILQPKYSVTEMRRTMALAKELLSSFRRFETLRSNPNSPEDSRSVWNFLGNRRQLNTGKMCYFMHQAGFDLDSDGDSLMKAGDVSCGCYDKKKGEIPECYLLVLFYFISAAKIENGLYNFDQKGSEKRVV